MLGRLIAVFTLSRRTDCLTSPAKVIEGDTIVVAEQVLDRAGAKGDRQSFHSLRHTFTDALRRAGATGEIIDGVLGWSRGNMRDRYGSGPWIAILAEVMQWVE